MRDLAEIDQMLAEMEGELQRLDLRRSELLALIADLKGQKAAWRPAPETLLRPETSSAVTHASPEATKIGLFRSLFRGREDVYPRRFESARSGKTGYQPACGNEWTRGICEKPKVRCNACPHRDFLPVTDEVLRNHLRGKDLTERGERDFTTGVYPMLPDETCWFLAADFDKDSWQDDARAFVETCALRGVPAALEKSRSGNGGHCWIFFSEAIPASLARRLGTILLTQTMERRPEIGLDSYDRFFPSQDTLPNGGFGNLIALPLQRKPRNADRSVFLDPQGTPYVDQWAFLSSMRRLNRQEVESVVSAAAGSDEWLGVCLPVTDENDDRPWIAPPSQQPKALPIVGPLPEQISLVVGNQIYVPKADIPPSLRNRLIRLAAFQNPEFYQAQAMRLSTFGKPRLISCCEDFPKHLGLPRGCLDELLELFAALKVGVQIADERFAGHPIDVQFQGTLQTEQQQAAEALLRHDTGVLAAATAFGKTVVAAYLIAQRKVNTLVVVHGRQLLDQWIEALGKFLGTAPSEIGQIGGGKHTPTGRIDVAMIQSLCQNGVVDDLVGDYGYVTVDECHHVSTVSFERVVRQCKAKYVTGLSATVARKDGHQPIVFMQCGPVRYKVSDLAQAAKRPFDHKVVIRPTTFDLPPALQNAKAIGIQDVYAALTQDDRRNRLIIEDVVAAAHAGRSPVVLTERREHLDLLVNLLAGRTENVLALTGGMGKKQRQKLADRIAGIPAGQPRVLVATGRYLGEGFDDTRLDTLFLALPIAWRGTLSQHAGRLHRLSATKQHVVIYDYVDFDVPVLARMYKKRRSGYATIGYEIIMPEKEHQPVQLVLRFNSF